VRQIAGPDRGRAGAGADGDVDVDGLALQVRRDRRLVEIGDGGAIAGNGPAAEGDAETCDIDRLARLADGHDHAAPIGVGAGDGRLDQG
jgi:hypothetical protein